MQPCYVVISSTLLWNPLHPPHPATHDVDEVQRVIASLPNNKAGHEVTSKELTLLLDWILRTCDVPATWRGGRLARPYKSKGPTESTDSYRGLLIGDHTTKVCTGVLAPEVKKAIEQFLPPQRCGNTRGGGTNRGHHVVSTFGRYARKHRTRQQFCSWTCPKHLTSWCAKSLLESAKHTDAVYGVTLFELSENIKDCGARMLCNRCSRAPRWKHQTDSLHTNKLEPVPITHVTFVDDEAIFITGTDNEELVANIKQVANTVDKTMSSHSMAVNWDPSKTEVIVLWAGKRTSACKRECNVEGVPGVSLESGRVCRFVQQYKHLGSRVTATPSPALEIRERIPQVPAKDGQISQSARSGQRTSLRCRSVEKMKTPSVFSLIASRRVNYAMSLCRCPLDPLLGLLSADDACPRSVVISRVM